MALRNIRTVGDEILNKRAREIIKKDIAAGSTLKVDETDGRLIVTE